MTRNHRWIWVLGLLGGMSVASAYVFADEADPGIPSEDAPPSVVVRPPRGGNPVAPLPGNAPGYPSDVRGDVMWNQRIIRLERMVYFLERRVMRLEEQLYRQPGYNPPAPPVPAPGPGGNPGSPGELNPRPVNSSWRCMIQDQAGTPFVSRASVQQDAVNAVVTLCLRFRTAAQCIPDVECVAESNN